MIFMAGFIDCAFCSRCSGNLKICHMAGGRTASSWLRPAFLLSLSLSQPHCHPSHPSVALISPKVHRRTPIPSDSSLLFDSNSVAVCGVNVNMAYGRPWVYYLHYLSCHLVGTTERTKEARSDSSWHYTYLRSRQTWLTNYTSVAISRALAKTTLLVGMH